MEWFRSYLVDRTTSVKVNNSRSCCSPVKYGVPQGSVLGPTLFNVYCRPPGRIIRKHDISYHMYADDSQLYVAFSPCDEKTALANTLCDERVDLTGLQLVIISARYVGEPLVNAL